MKQKIEDLIDLALTDNKLSEKEKLIIYEKAKEIGVNQGEVDSLIKQKLNNLNTTQKDNTEFDAEEWKENLSGFKKFLLLFNKDIIKPLLSRFKNNPTSGSLVLAISLIFFGYLFSSFILGLLGILVFAFWIYLIQKNK